MRRERFPHPVPIGPSRTADGWSFTVWAPLASSLVLELPGSDLDPVDMRPDAEEPGYWRAEIEGLSAGSLYGFRMDRGPLRPDPASHFQPLGVHEPSALVDHEAFHWRNLAFKPLTMGEVILYELHIGAFTQEGSFQAAIARLDDLAELGVTAVEVMPVAQFPGERNWGYDGVHPYAIQNSYGGPQGFKAFVDACHGRGLAVMLDVVYNHLGPEGNYLADFGPYFSARYTTPWGLALNFDGPHSDGVRNFFVQNALFWFRHYRIDGLRLDAVHSIHDEGPHHFLRELAEARDVFAQETGRRPLLMAESHLNSPRLVEAYAQNGLGLDAMWSDDLHHSVHAFLTGERDGYYQDHGSLEHVADTLEHGFAYEGQLSAYWKRAQGVSGRHLPPQAFINFLQTHDMTGNRAGGERLSTLIGFELAKAAAALLLLTPYTPLLFMGEEYAENNPFLYFVSHGDHGLVEAVRNGRKREFADFAWNKSSAESSEPADPQDEETFQRSKLDWDKRSQGLHARMLAYYRECIRLRKLLFTLADTTPHVDKISAGTFGPDTDAAELKHGLRALATDQAGVLALDMHFQAGHLLVIFNFSATPLDRLDSLLPRAPFMTEVLSSADARWGGPEDIITGRTENILYCPPASALVLADERLASYLM
ncbi:malto-oligosyltrehalose trehalohydrolase [Desulfocurvibacter africanus]|uniref:malto-oligosyltrehalose trehalohydrolase n=1 Tax=Desulfocurvibacter africanus TaxID=873 RepID=UPI0003FDF06E|nr:malto-oligosyltrehalose trehalohydrolase [Desulfocurvibacter africanus]